MFCENCGANIPDNSKFCTGCGATLDSAAPAAPAQQPVQAAAPVPQPQPAYAAPQPPPFVYAPPQQPQPQQRPQQQYNQAAEYGSVQSNREPLSVGNYIVMFILCAIPIVGLICLLVWAFGGGSNLNKKNYARAALILSLIALVLWIIVIVVGGVAIGSIFNSLGGYY